MYNWGSRDEERQWGTKHFEGRMVKNLQTLEKHKLADQEQPPLHPHYYKENHSKGHHKIQR